MTRAGRGILTTMAAGCALLAGPALTVGAAPAAANLCGAVQSYSPATAGDTGQLNLGGRTYTIAPGGSIASEARLVPGAILCVTVPTADALAGRITQGSVITAPPANATPTAIDLASGIAPAAGSTTTAPVTTVPATSGAPGMVPNGLPNTGERPDPFLPLALAALGVASGYTGWRVRRAGAVV